MLYVNGQIWVFVDEYMDIEILRDEEPYFTLRVFNQNHEIVVVIILVYAKCTQEERMHLENTFMKCPWIIKSLG